MPRGFRRGIVAAMVTDDGEPLVEPAPVEDPLWRPTMDSVRLLAEEDEAYFSTGAWSGQVP